MPLQSKSQDRSIHAFTRFVWGGHVFLIPKALAFPLSVLLFCSFAYGTSEVVKVSKDEILFAADTRRGKATGLSVNSQEEKDDLCKIVTERGFAFAPIGRSDYQPVTTSDAVAPWNAFQDASAAYWMHPKDLDAQAEDWGKRAAAHYASFYAANSNRVSMMANERKDHLLVRGIFAGWDIKGVAKLIFMDVTLNGTIVDHEAKYMEARELPYSGNEITTCIIENCTEKAKEIRKEWFAKATTFPKRERAWRELEFFIQATSVVDPKVGRDVEVLRLTHSRAQWLQNRACHTPARD